MYLRMATRNSKERKLHQRHQDKFYYVYKSINKTRVSWTRYLFHKYLALSMIELTLTPLVKFPFLAVPCGHP